LLIAIGAFLDPGATNLTRPQNVYFSQALVGFGALLFIGPAMGIGIPARCSPVRRTSSAGSSCSARPRTSEASRHRAVGTFQTVREKFHSHSLVEQSPANQSGGRRRPHA
jgi:hypothetical protein